MALSVRMRSGLAAAARCAIAAAVVATALGGSPARAEGPAVSRSDQALASFTAMFARTPDASETKLAEFRKLFEADKVDGWRFAEWGDSYAALYEATKDKSYFLALAKLSQLALEFRDDRKERVDQLTGKSVAAWGVYDRYFQKRAARVGVAALILAPIARLRRFAVADPALAKEAGVDPEQLRTDIVAGLAAFEPLLERRDRDGVKTARYLIPAATSQVDCDAVPDQVMPQWNKTNRQMCARQKTLALSPEAYNLQLRTALVHLLLGDAASVETARAIAADFMTTSGFKIGPEGAATFTYVEGGRSEDISHLNLDVEFFLEAARSAPGMQAGGQRVDRALLLALAKSITDVAAVPLDASAIPPDAPSDRYVLTPYIDGRFARRIDDQKVRDQVLGDRFSRIRRSCKQFTELVSVSPKIADVCGYHLKFRRALSASGLAHLAKGFREGERSASR